MLVEWSIRGEVGRGSTISNPPPIQRPSTAAIMGFLPVRRERPAKPPGGCFREGSAESLLADHSGGRRY